MMYNTYVGESGAGRGESHENNKQLRVQLRTYFTEDEWNTSVSPKCQTVSRVRDRNPVDRSNFAWFLTLMTTMIHTPVTRERGDARHFVLASLRNVK